MAACSSSGSGSSCLGVVFIENYSHNMNPLEQIYNQINLHLTAPYLDEVQLNALLDAAESGYNDLSGSAIEMSIKEKINELTLDTNVKKRTYAFFMRDNINSTLAELDKLFQKEFHPETLAQHTDVYFESLSKIASSYKYLQEMQWKNIQFHTVEILNFERRISLDAFRETIPEVFITKKNFLNRLKSVLRPIFENPGDRFKSIAKTMNRNIEIESLLKSEHWELVAEIAPEPVASSSNQKSEVFLTETSSQKKHLAKIIENISDRILKHYGSTIVNLLVNPLIDCFKMESLQEIVNNSLENLFPTFLKQENEERKRWVQFICSSIPAALSGFLSVPLQTISDPKEGYAFIHGITKLLQPLCFGTPGRIGNQHKALVLNMLPQITLFLNDYQASVKMAREQNVTPLANENFILRGMIQNIQTRHTTQIFRNERNPKMYREDLQNLIRNLIVMQFDLLTPPLPLAVKAVAIEITKDYVYKIFDSMLSPFCIAVLVHRLVDCQEKLNVPAETSTTPPTSHIPDNQFTRALATEYWNAIQPILKLGGNPIVISSLVNLFENPIREKLFDLSKKTSEEMHTVLSSDCVLMPFILFDSILFHKQGDDYVPAIGELLNADQEKRQRFTRNILENFKGTPYKHISEMIKNNTSTLALKAAEAFVSLDEFLSNVFDQLNELSSQDKILKLLLVYLVDGYTNYLNEVSPCPTTPTTFLQGESSGAAATTAQTTYGFTKP